MDSQVSDIIFRSILNRHNYSVEVWPERITIVKGELRSSKTKPYKNGGILLSILGILLFLFGSFVVGIIILFTSVPLFLKGNKLVSLEVTGVKLVEFSKSLVSLQLHDGQLLTVAGDWYDALEAEVEKDNDLSLGFLFFDQGNNNAERILEFYDQRYNVVLDDLNLVLRYLFQFIHRE